MARNVLAALQWFDPRLLAGIASVAREHGWNLVCSAHHQDVDVVPKGWTGDGAVSLMSDERMHRRLRMACDHVVELGYWGPRHLPRVVPDHDAVADLAVAHFRERGFTSFACLEVPGEPMFTQRADRFCTALGDTDASVTRLSWPPSGAGRDWVARLALLGRQLQALPRPLAVFAVQDRVGAEAILAARSVGLAVPDEVSVLGVDNLELLAETLPVPLSSIDTDPQVIGSQAALLLLDAMRGRAVPRLTTVMPAGLILRGSTAEVGTTDPLVLSFLAALDRQTGWTVPRLVRHLGCSGPALAKACIRVLGCSPGLHLRRHRLRCAGRALAAGASLAEAAKLAGIAGATGLCSLIRREKGMTPAAWRRELQQGANHAT